MHNCTIRFRQQISGKIGQGPYPALVLVEDESDMWLEGRPESPSWLQIANEIRSAFPQVLEVERLRLRPSGSTARISSRFSQKEDFPAGLLATVCFPEPPSPGVTFHFRDQVWQVFWSDNCGCRAEPAVM